MGYPGAVGAGRVEEGRGGGATAVPIYALFHGNGRRGLGGGRRFILFLCFCLSLSFGLFPL